MRRLPFAVPIASCNISTGMSTLLVKDERKNMVAKGTWGPVLDHTTMEGESRFVSRSVTPLALVHNFTTVVPKNKPVGESTQRHKRSICMSGDHLG